MSLQLRGKSIRTKDSGTRYIIHRVGIYRCLSSMLDDKQKRKVSPSKKNYSSDSPLDLPSQSQIVIAGAGTVANSVAYHLVLNGWNDVLVLEQNT